jgi:hypothetical protein
MIVLAIVLLYQGYVSARVVWHGAYSRRQKVLQLALVWLVPLLGAALVHLFFASDASPQKPVDTRFFTDGGNNPPGIGG